MLWALSNLQTRVVRADHAELHWLREKLSFENEKARFTKAPDTKVRLFNVVSQTFPTGWAAILQTAAQRDGFKVEVVDKRVRPCEPDPSADLRWLRPYQRPPVDAALRRTRGLIWAPTGSGKSEVAIAVVLSLPCRALFVVSSGSLLDQTIARWKLRTGQDCGRIGDGEWSPDPRFTVATFQTLYHRLGTAEGRDFLTSVELLIVDEVHGVPAGTYYRVAMNTPKAYWRFGLSGTPLARSDKRSQYTIAAIGGVIHRIRAETLVQAGAIAAPRIRMLPLEQESDCPTWAGVYGELVARSTKRNGLLVKAVLSAEKPCLLFVKEITHGRLLRKMLEKAGLNVEFLHGAHSLEHRSSETKRLVRGHHDVLIASKIFQEGVDIPELRSVVVASGGKSVIEALQRIGRGMRVVPGKDHVQVYDVLDTGNDWTARHARARLRAYCSEGYATSTGPLLESSHAEPAP